MDKGISFYWGFDNNIEERAKILNTIGFNSVITNADPKYARQDSSIQKQMIMFNKYNLKPSSLHMRYECKDLPYFWTKSYKGRWLEKRLVKDVKIAHRYGFKYVVVHVKGLPNQTGLDRLNRVLKLCEKLNVDLAVENTESIACFEYIFANIKHNHLKFCYDSGHDHCFTPEMDLLSKYGNRLVCLHLHDNMGKDDDHTLNKYGSIDWNDLAQKLAQLNFNGSLDYEIFMRINSNETAFDVAKEVYNQACELEKLIEKYKQNK